MAVACLFIGPATFIHTPPLTIPLIYAMCATAGLGVGLVGISTFSRLYLAVLGLGYKDDIHTFLLVSGENLNFEHKGHLCPGLTSCENRPVAEWWPVARVFHGQPN